MWEEDVRDLPCKKHGNGPASTNCPVGNRRNTSTSKERARKYRHSLGTCQGKGLAGTVIVARLIGPNVTSMRATNSAMRSSGLRQTITVLTTKHTTTEVSVSTTMDAA
jgi:hypothetical protein